MKIYFDQEQDMPNIKSAEKRLRQSLKRRDRNRTTKATSDEGLMRAINRVETAQNTPSVLACGIDQNAVNSAKDKIYREVQKIESAGS